MHAHPCVEWPIKSPFEANNYACLFLSNAFVYDIASTMCLVSPHIYFLPNNCFIERQLNTGTEMIIMSVPKQRLVEKNKFWWTHQNTKLYARRCR